MTQSDHTPQEPVAEQATGPTDQAGFETTSTQTASTQTAGTDTASGQTAGAEQAGEYDAGQSAEAATGTTTEPAEDGQNADQSGANASAEEPETEEESLRRQLNERTADLQRVQADYTNYRKRMDHDRSKAREHGKSDVLKSLLTVLDDVGRADQHGELVGGFKAVSDQLWDAVQSHGLEPFGQAGDLFDPKLHDALYHAGTSAEAIQTTIDAVVKTGYRVGDEIIRYAEVAVIEPEQADDDGAVATDGAGSAINADSSGGTAGAEGSAGANAPATDGPATGPEGTAEDPDQQN